MQTHNPVKVCPLMAEKSPLIGRLEPEALPLKINTRCSQADILSRIDRSIGRNLEPIDRDIIEWNCIASPRRPGIPLRAHCSIQSNMIIRHQKIPPIDLGCMTGLPRSLGSVVIEGVARCPLVELLDPILDNRTPIIGE